MAKLFLNPCNNKQLLVLYNKCDVLVPKYILSTNF